MFKKTWNREGIVWNMYLFIKSNIYLILLEGW